MQTHETVMTKWLNTTMAAAHFGISTWTLMRWPQMKGFPDNAVRAVGATTLYEIDKVAEWLRSRPPARRRPYKWQADGVSTS
jgi:hypothetical protein